MKGVMSTLIQSDYQKKKKKPSTTCLLYELCKLCRVKLFNEYVVLGSRDHDKINKCIVFLLTHIGEY